MTHTPSPSKFIISIEGEPSFRDLAEKGIRLVTADMPTYQAIQAAISIHDGKTRETAGLSFKTLSHLTEDIMRKLTPGKMLEVDATRWNFTGGFYVGVVLEIHRVFDWDYTPPTKEAQASNIVLFPNSLER